MQAIVGLSVGILIAVFAIYHSVYKQMNHTLTIILLVFSLVAGLAIANWNFITKFKWGQMEIYYARQAINEFKQTALNEIENEVADQKESIKLLIARANDIRERMEQQKRDLEGLIKTATDLQNKIEEQTKVTMSLNKSAQKTQAEIEELNAASAQIALSIIRAFYFTMETKSEFGGPRSQKAMEEIFRDFNRILPMVIPEPEERAEWVRRLQSTLPERD